MSKPAFLADESFFVGRCQSCRHARQEQHQGAAGGLLLFCHEQSNRETTRPQWTCGRYDYEPGSLG